MLLNVKDASCSIMMGFPTKEWGGPPSPELMFCKTSTQEFLKTEPINNNMKTVSTSIIPVGDIILADAAEAGINKNCAFSTTSRHATHSSMENTYQISKILSMVNIYVSIVTQE